MPVLICPNCEMRVVPKDGICPSCQKLASTPASQLNPYAIEGTPVSQVGRSSEIKNTQRMTTSAQVYTGVVFAFAILFLLGTIAYFSAATDGGRDFSDLGFVLFTSAYVFGIGVGLALTAVINIRKKSLNIISTVVQCLLLVFACYGLPLALWGVILLRKSISSQRDAN